VPLNLFESVFRPADQLTHAGPNAGPLLPDAFSIGLATLDSMVEERSLALDHRLQQLEIVHEPGHDPDQLVGGVVIAAVFSRAAGEQSGLGQASPLRFRTNGLH
jgi:hypothetical protein